MTSTAVHHNHHHETNARVLFGFWVFLLGDCVLFAAMFASYVVLQHHTYGSIGIKQIASLPYILVQTLLILGACFTYGLASMGAKSNSVGMAVFWMLVTLVLGAGFVGMGFHQLASLVQHGYTWRTSAFLSIFFLIIAIHAVHYVVAMFWSLVLLVQFPLQGMSDRMKTRMACLGLFFNFLNLMWVFIFTVVFLLGAV